MTDTIKKPLRKPVAQTAEPTKAQVVANPAVYVTNETSVNFMEETNKKIDALMAEMAVLMEENAKLRDKQKETKPDITANRLVTIIHLCDNLPGLKTHIKTHNVLLNFGRFGETATLSFQHFEELFREYRDYFERNVIGLTSRDEDLCELYNIKKTYRSPLSKSMLDNICVLDDAELKRIYELVPQTQKDVIVRSFVMGYFETDVDGKYPKDRRYKNRDRIELLNKLSGGQLKRILDDLDLKAADR
jgi:hypothetical protein